MASTFRVFLLLSLVATALVAGQPLAKDDVVALLQNGFSETVIIRKIRASGVAFEVDVASMLELKRAGATEGVLLALLDGREIGEAVPQPKVSEPGMVLIPAGPFRMGSEGGSDFSPPRVVRVDAFYIDRHEVTNEEYERFDSAHRRERASGCDTCPVTNVSWEEAMAYAHSVGKRLPTEAEWEKAARGPEGSLFGYGPEFRKELAVVEASSARAVGSHQPNGYGTYDMLGNVWEWCSDHYASDAYTRLQDRNPKGAESGIGRSVRGGSFRNGSEVHLAVRTWSNPAYRYRSIGFRCARDANQDGGVTP